MCGCFHVQYKLGVKLGLCFSVAAAPWTLRGHWRSDARLLSGGAFVGDGKIKVALSSLISSESILESFRVEFESNLQSSKNAAPEQLEHETLTQVPRRAVSVPIFVPVLQC